MITNMKKSVLLILLILIAGCGQINPQTEQPRPQEFRTGTEGLYMEFLQNLPPPQIVADGQTKLQAVLKVENRGTHDMGTGTKNMIFLAGFDKNILNLQNNNEGQRIGKLTGRGPFIPQGDFTNLNFEADIYLPQGTDKYVPTLLAIACYRYITQASAQVCIDPDPYSPFSKQKVCTPQTVSTGSQGAPIAVTQVEVIPAPKKTRFVIHIQNVGNGHVFKDEGASYEHCNPYKAGLAYNELNQVKVTDVSLASEKLLSTCKPLSNDGYVPLVNGMATLHCETGNLGTIQTAYMTPLNIQLEYGYRQSVSRQVEIRASDS